MNFIQQLFKIRGFFLFGGSKRARREREPEAGFQALGGIKANIWRYGAAAVLAGLGAALISGCSGKQRPVQDRPAVQQGSESPAECIASKAKSNKTSPGDTQLHQAVRSLDLKLVECLLGRGGDPNAQNDEGESPIHQLSIKGISDTPEELAAAAEILQYIIGNSEAADIDAVSEKHLQTPLQLAVWTKHSGSAKILIQNGADIYAQGGSLIKNAFELAKQQNNTEILELMKKAGSEGPEFHPADDSAPPAESAPGQTADQTKAEAEAAPETAPEESPSGQEDSQPKTAAAEPEPAPEETAPGQGGGQTEASTEGGPGPAASTEPETAPEESPSGQGDGQTNTADAEGGPGPVAEAEPAEGPWLPTDESIAQGGKIYQTYCFVCHGAGGLGDGPAATGFNPPPRNLVEGQWTNGGSSKELFITLREGIPGSSMTPFKHLSVTDRWALVHYIRSITGNKAEDDLKDLEAFAKKEEGADK